MINTIRGTCDFTTHSAGTHTDFYEISEEEYKRITAIDNYRGKLNSEYEARMPVGFRWGYGFYGANVTDIDGKYYYTISTGNSCE